MQIGVYNVLVKPALVVLVGAVAIAAVGIPFMKHYNADREAAFGLVHPERWKFETRNGAVATLTMQTGAGAAKLLPVRGGLYQVDSADGFTIVVQKKGATPDSVYLRNGFVVDQTSDSHDLQFSFEAQAPMARDILFIVRDGQTNYGKLVWSHDYNITSSDWTTYHDTIPAASLQKASTANLIVAAQLGDAPGTISLRNIEIH